LVPEQVNRNTPLPTLKFNTEGLNLQPGLTYTFTLSVEDYIPSAGTGRNNTDFKVLYSIAVNYDDTNPPSSNNTALGFTLTRSPPATTSGGQIGSTLTYTATVSNKLSNRTLGLTVVIIRIPSCYTMNFEAFEGLKAQGLIDMYEFQNGNSEVWIYIKSIGPGQTKTFAIDL
jgi:hypothetical protein